MRLAWCALVGLHLGGVMMGTASAALTAVTDLTASANRWDRRTSDNGCVPNSCHAELAVDGSIDEQSRWSCQAGDSSVDACKLVLTLDKPEDLVEMRVSLLKGDERIRSMKILVDGTLATTITSSGATVGFETYELTVMNASIVVIQAAESMPENGWLSIIELELMVESDAMLEETTASAPPTDETYVGCFVDTLDDRIMSIVTTTDDLTPEACAAYCTGMDNGYVYYTLQQGDECWCSGCDLTSDGTNTAYDRHGVGVCTAACAGDSSMACGGDMSFSLYQTASCGTTLSPTPSPFETPGNGCPAGSIPPSLEISLAWLEDDDLDLHVIEPGGKDVFYGERRGDVGIMSNDNADGPGSETFTLQNGLNVEDDKVLGTYSAFVTNGDAGTTWVMTARLAGELSWSVSGVILESSSSDDLMYYTVDVTDYTESTCGIDIYGTCPAGTFSDDGTSPCTACNAGGWSDEGSSSCYIAALKFVDASPALLSALEEDATGGFAGPGTVELEGGSSIWNQISLDENDGGELEVAGIFQRDDDLNTSLPSSTALLVYLELEDGSFSRGDGTIVPSTGEFFASMTGIPDGFSKIFYSFVVLDPEESLEIEDPFGSSVFDAEVISFSCPSPLTITLEWSTGGTDLDMQVTEPDGSTHDPWEIGTYGFGSGDVNDGYGPEIWAVYPGNPDAAGTYTVQLLFQYVEQVTEWTLTARVNGEVAWVETGVYDPYGGGISYSSSGDSGEDGPFYVTLESDDTDGC